MQVQTPDGPRTVPGTKLLVAIGVQGNIEHLGLETAGVRSERGFIPVDAHCRTNVPGIYAIGDVNGPPCLAHVASAEGIATVEAIARGQHRILLVMATGTGKTYTAFQIIWRLWKSGRAKRVVAPTE